MLFKINRRYKAVVKRADCESRNKSDKAANQEPFEIYCAALADFPCDICTDNHTDEKAECRVQDIAQTAAACKNREADKTNQYIDENADCAVFTACDNSCKGCEKYLQGNGAEESGDFYKCTHGDKCRKQRNYN